MRCPKCKKVLFTKIAAATLVTIGLDVHKEIVCDNCNSSIDLILPQVARADKAVPWGLLAGSIVSITVLYYTDWPMPIKIVVMLISGLFLFVLFWLVIIFSTKIKSQC